MLHDGFSVCGGLDLGGTKIEATLFDNTLKLLKTRRRPTPQISYDDLLTALRDEINWLHHQAEQLDIPIGIGIPGVIDPQTGLSLTANLPANGKPLYADLKAAVGSTIVIENDCKCFAFSEANGGAGADYQRVFGLIMGTGLGGGFCVDGRLNRGFNGIAGEIGHYGLPAHLVGEYHLPLLECGCGRIGCYETLISGNGLSALAQSLTGEKQDGEAIVSAANKGDMRMRQVLDLWARLIGELLHTIQLHLDPDCLVLGGGLSNILNVIPLLERAMERSLLPSVRAFKILMPKFGDSSGGRGAALLALQKASKNYQEHS